MTRVFYAVERGPVSCGGVRSSLWRENLYRSLSDVADEVIEFDYDLDGVSQQLSSRATTAAAAAEIRELLGRTLREQLLFAHRTQAVDLLFTYFSSEHCAPSVIADIRKHGILTVNWYCNASYQFDLIRGLAPAFDYCLVPEKFRLSDYANIGARPIYCPEAANPHVYRPYPLAEQYDVVFVGQRYGDRQAYLHYLLKNGVQIRVWGPGWKREMDVAPSPSGSLREGGRRVHRIISSGKPGDLRLTVGKAIDKVRYRIPSHICGGALTDQALVEMYSRAKVSLGLSACGETHRTKERILQVRLRDLEALMSGAFYITEYQDDLAEMFEEDKEIIFYRSKEELLEKVRYYLCRVELRRQIRTAGRKRALAEHTWQKRFEEMFNTIGLPCRQSSL